MEFFELRTSDWTREYAEGWCAGYKMAREAVMRNRDHYRELCHYPAEAHEKSMARIYEGWPPRAPENFKMDNIVARQLNLEMVGIDLYVVLPPLRLTFKIEGGEEFTC